MKLYLQGLMQTGKYLLLFYDQYDFYAIMGKFQDEYNRRQFCLTRTQKPLREDLQ